jgi:hypothetical protein
LQTPQAEYNVIVDCDALVALDEDGGLTENVEDAGMFASLRQKK